MDNETTKYSFSAKCDACSYVARSKTKKKEEAARLLAQDLAEHNKEVHNQDTDVEGIIKPVEEKMKQAN